MKSRVKNYTNTMNNNQNALLSVSDKTPAFFELADNLHRHQWSLIASGGTRVKLVGRDLPVIDVSEITNFGPVLGHRVVTLAPQIHGGLLTDPENPAMVAELDSLGWSMIDLLVCTFYPLEATIAKDPTDINAIIESIDIGGPAMVRSACKGKKLVLTSEDQYAEFMHRLENRMITPSYRLLLQAEAADRIYEYALAERKFRRSLVWPNY